MHIDLPVVEFFVISRLLPSLLRGFGALRSRYFRVANTAMYNKSVNKNSCLIPRCCIALTHQRLKSTAVSYCMSLSRCVALTVGNKYSVKLEAMRQRSIPHFNVRIWQTQRWPQSRRTPQYRRLFLQCGSGL